MMNDAERQQLDRMRFVPHQEGKHYIASSQAPEARLGVARMFSPSRLVVNDEMFSTKCVPEVTAYIKKYHAK